MKKVVMGITVTIGMMFISTGCTVTQGNANINDRKTTNKVKKGFTKAQVRSILGNPSSTMMLNNGEQWTYSYAQADFNVGSHLARSLSFEQFGGDRVSGNKNTTFIVKFNNAGRVVSKKYGF